MATRIRLGELLVRAGVIDELKLKAALSEQQKWGGRLGKILVDMNFVSEELLVKALSKQLGVPRATFTAPALPAEFLQKIDYDFAVHNELVPEAYDMQRRVLVVAIADPTNVAALDELRFRTGLRIETTIAGHNEIMARINRVLRPGATFGIEVPDAIELSESSADLVQNENYRAAMAASGMPMIDSGGSPVPQPDPGAWNPNGPPPGQPPPPPTQQPMSTPPVTQPPPQPAVAGSAPAQGSAADLANRLDGAQKQQAKALRVMLELLIDKGVFSHDDYLNLVNRQR